MALQVKPLGVKCSPRIDLLADGKDTKSLADCKVRFPGVLFPPKVTHAKLRKSTLLEVFDVPIELLIDSKENPNQQDEATFDRIVQEMRTEGFDEPIQVVPVTRGPEAGKYIIVSGHHRKKAAAVLKFTHVPCVIKSGWDDDKRLIELVFRNNARGQINPEKFTQVFLELKRRGYDESVLKVQMAFTKEDAFKKVFKEVEKSLNPAQKKQLAKSKEKIKNVDGLSSVLNTIFKEHGSDLDHGFVVFNFAGKKHHFIECDSQLHKMMENLEAEARSNGMRMADIFKVLVSKPDLSRVPKSVTIPTTKPIRLIKRPS